MNFPIDDDTVILTQQVLVQIWQLHINDWYNGADRTVAEPLPRHGHVLKIMYGGGVFCQKCGKSTKLQKHQRLNFCPNPVLVPIYLAINGYKHQVPLIINIACKKPGRTLIIVTTNPVIRFSGTKNVVKRVPKRMIWPPLE